MFAGIRAETPVLHVEVGGGSGRYRHDEKAPRITSLFTVTSYELAQQVLTDHERFSSAANAMTIGPVMGRTILEMDPPEHQRRHTRDDLVSQLISAEVDGRRLSDDEIYPFLLLLLPAGAETTYRSSSNLLFGLLSHPGQLDMVRADRGVVPQAIEEALRWETPLLTVARSAPRTWSWAERAFPRGASWRRRWGRPTGIRDGTPTQMPSMSYGRAGRPSRSAVEFISAWGCTWRGWRGLMGCLLREAAGYSFGGKSCRTAGCGAWGGGGDPRGV